jgi:hypothetical protein
MRRLSFFILSFFAVLAGYLIYLGWRDVVPSWGFVHHNRQLWHFLRQSLGGNIYLPEWMVYSLPQGLWAFGFSLCLGGIWYDGPVKVGYSWQMACLVIVVLWEVFQRLGYISGTFCRVDMLTGICGIGVGVILFTFKKLES